MNTKLATTQIRLTEWASIIKDCRASGLKVDEYCQQHNLSRDAYYYWLRKVKAAALQQAGFVELPAPEKPNCGCRFFCISFPLHISSNVISDFRLNNATDILHRKPTVTNHLSGFF